ncbi:MAG TPA: cyclic nucleotide-binding domain-containing protein [Gemmataceae bacterium]|nr:cyclic nucleotide-binding domain-containing protein [Gemmataceae bacterium]
MSTPETTVPAVAAEAQEFIRGVIDSAAQLRLPALFTGQRPKCVYRIPNRGGVSLVALRTVDLTEQELVSLMRYRLAQYLAVNFVDRQKVYEARMEYEPLTNLRPGDVHFIAGSVETGEVLCYATLEVPPDASPGTTLRQRDRPLFPVERIHGWGIYNRLRLLPDLPLAKLRELGRFVKNQRLHTFDELGVRGPIEVVAAVFRSLIGALRLEVEAILGDLEEGVAKQNFEYFHCPLAVIRGTVPYEAEASYFFPRYQFCNVYPFAALSSDVSGPMLGRLEAIEAALEQPGKRGLLALFALKREVAQHRSGLEPPEGLAPLTKAGLSQRTLPMIDRRQLLDNADRLRLTDLFSGLSVAEAAVLGTFMERMEIPADQVIVRQGDRGDDLYLIEAGQAAVQITTRDGQVVPMRTLGQGQYFGEIALLLGGRRTADVIAVTPMTLLRLTKAAYTRYLSHAVEVEQRMTRTAVDRTHAMAQAILRGDS